ncbi:MAG: hypothetical protein DYG94_04810 [Leptolyngbya sp. PLA3]|nr:MAG: hypothetical protein EDM82_03960 [Cyanobacteria bacterium CYA]MCE7968053.1 hypothetical protein [Leptolyngbya sp. PL-A3]
MGMSKRQKGSLVILVLGLGALGVDRLVLIPGPAMASAGADMLESLPVLDLPKVSALAEKLLATSEPSANLLAGVSPEQPICLDAFASLLPKEVELPAMLDAGIEPARVQARPASRTPTLSAIVLTESGGYAVLNGRPVGLGASRDGFTLKSLSARTATIEMDGVSLTLSLSGSGERIMHEVSP